MTIKFLHVRACDASGNILPQGGITVAYTCTLKDIILQLSRCRQPSVTMAGNETSGDLFCYRTGRVIAAGRLRTEEPYEVLTLVHPITRTIAKWLSENFYEGGTIKVFVNDKGRWMSTFEFE